MKKIYLLYLLIFTLTFIWLIFSFVSAEFVNPLKIMKVKPSDRIMFLLFFFGIYSVLYTMFNKGDKENINK